MNKSIPQKSNLQLIFFMVPFGLSLSFALIGRLAFAFAAILLQVLFVLCLSFCRKRENLWMFVTSTFSLLPIIIKTSILGAEVISDFLFTDSRFLFISAAVLVFEIVFCVEQLILGAITRLLRKRQFVVDVD